MSLLTAIFKGRTIKLPDEPLPPGNEEKMVPPGRSVPSSSLQYGITKPGWRRRDLIAAGLESNIYVYACIRHRAMSLSSANFFAADSKNERLPDGAPLQQLITKPNPNWTFPDFIEQCQQILDSVGELFIIKIRWTTKGAPKALWPVTPGSVVPVPDVNGMIKEFIFTDPMGQKSHIPKEDIIHVLYPNPRSPYYGMSPLEAAIDVVDFDTRSVQWNRNLIDNATGVGMVVKIDERLSEEDWQDYTKRLETGFSGFVNAGAPMIIGKGMTIEAMPSTTPNEMDWIQSRKMNREDICAAFAVPPPLIGIYDKATLSNIETANKMFWQNTMTYLVNRWARALTMMLAMDFDRSSHIAYDISHIEPIQKNTLGKIDSVAKLVALGVPFSVANEFVKLSVPRFQGDDVSRVPSSMIEAGEFGGEDVI